MKPKKEQKNPTNTLSGIECAVICLLSTHMTFVILTRMQRRTFSVQVRVRMPKQMALSQHTDHNSYHCSFNNSIGFFRLLFLYSFYTTLFEHQFKQCMEFLAQHRYSIIFPMICSHFMNATHSLCPEEVGQGGCHLQGKSLNEECI